MIYRLFNLATYMLGQKFGNQRVLEVGSAFIKLVRDLKFYNIEDKIITLDKLNGDRDGICCGKQAKII